MVKKEHAYCCICGKEILCNFDTETSYIWKWEKYACETHTQEEREKYIFLETPGYCSVCGIKFYTKEPDCEHSNTIK